MSTFSEELPVAPRLPRTNHTSKSILLKPRDPNDRIGDLSEDYEYTLQCVRGNGLNIRYLRYPGEELCLTAVQQTGLALEFISSPSFPVVCAAIQKHPSAIRFLKNPHPVFIQLALHLDPSVSRFISVQ